MTTTESPQGQPVPTEPIEYTADASAELKHYADKYHGMSMRDQFEHCLIFAKLVAAESGNTSLTNSEVQWLYRSVWNHLTETRLAAQPSGATVSRSELRDVFVLARQAGHTAVYDAINDIEDSIEALLARGTGDET